MSAGSTTDQGATPAELEADIARQRDELAATVSELQARLDVKARAREKVAAVPRTTWIGLGAGALLVVGLVTYRRRTS